MIKLTNAPILPNCQVPNGYYCISLQVVKNCSTFIIVSVSLVRENLRGSRENLKHKIRTLVAIKDELSEDEREILDVITKCRDEEQEHHDTGLEQEAEKAFGYPVLSAVITAGCKIAILASEKV